MAAAPGAWPWRRGARWLFGLVLVWLIAVAAKIALVGAEHAKGAADAALVLGAAIDDDRPSPVFAERIRHGIQLYRSGRVRTLVFTGGRSEGSLHAESSVARDFALAQGVPATAILTEARSRTTLQNLTEAAPLLRAHGIRTIMIVSDPLHLARALRMARDQGLVAAGAPTPTSRYRSWSTRLGFLLRELYFYNHYLLTGQ